jgi:hypothetical protein
MRGTRRLSTTTDVYLEWLEPEVRSALHAMHDELTGNGTTARERLALEPTSAWAQGA